MNHSFLTQVRVQHTMCNIFPKYSDKDCIKTCCSVFQCLNMSSWEGMIFILYCGSFFIYFLIFFLSSRDNEKVTEFNFLCSSCISTGRFPSGSFSLLYFFHTIELLLLSVIYLFTLRNMKYLCIHSISLPLPHFTFKKKNPTYIFSCL